jgi:UDP-4-amino-4,6-dideoxy-N-acetyl-beta-L-altrosamine N-acetyltransferase
MYSDELISEEIHHEWFSKAIHDQPSCQHRIAILDGQPIGLMSITNIDSRHKNCEWGGYLLPEVPRGSGYGNLLLSASISHIFEELEFHRIHVEVLTNNLQAIGLYEKNRFINEGTIRDRALHSDGWKDAHIYGLLRSDWLL